MTETTVETAAEPVALPEGEYAIVEMMGHRTVVGRIAEVERFGTKFLALEAVFNGGLLPAIFCGGASIYCLTPIPAEAALKRGGKRLYELAPGMAAIVPPHLLPPPEPDRQHFAYDEDEDR